MTLKLIAIVILALLGLSSVMNAKAFRVFLGGMGALCVLVLFGVLSMPDRSSMVAKRSGVARNLTSKLQAIFDPQPDFRESAETTAQQILDDIKLGRDREQSEIKSADQVETTPQGATKKQDRPNDRPRVMLQRFPISVKKDTEENERVSTAENLRAVVTSYLDWYKKRSNEIGVDRLQYENLNPLLLKFVEKNRDEDGQVKLTVVFDDTFHQHVRLSGRRVVRKERLRSAASVAAAVGTLLFLSYGTLKVLNSRRRRQDADYLQTSNISMV